MSVEKNITIFHCLQQTIEGEAQEAIVQRVEGKWYDEEKIKYFTYEEKSELGVIYNRLVVKDNGLYLERSGAIEMVLHWSNGQITKGSYQSKIITLDYECKCHKVVFIETIDGICVQVNYQLTIGGAVTENEMTMEVKYH